MEINIETLDKLNRKEIQDLAKKNGLKANSSTQQIKQSLLEIEAARLQSTESDADFKGTQTIETFDIAKDLLSSSFTSNTTESIIIGSKINVEIESLWVDGVVLKVNKKSVHVYIPDNDFTATVKRCNVRLKIDAENSETNLDDHHSFVEVQQPETAPRDDSRQDTSDCLQHCLIAGKPDDNTIHHFPIEIAPDLNGAESGNSDPNIMLEDCVAFGKDITGMEFAATFIPLTSERADNLSVIQEKSTTILQQAPLAAQIQMEQCIGELTLHKRFMRTQVEPVVAKPRKSSCFYPEGGVPAARSVKSPGFMSSTTPRKGLGTSHTSMSPRGPFSSKKPFQTSAIKTEDSIVLAPSKSGINSFTEVTSAVDLFLHSQRSDDRKNQLSKVPRLVCTAQQFKAKPAPNFKEHHQKNSNKGKSLIAYARQDKLIATNMDVAFEEAERGLTNGLNTKEDTPLSASKPIFRRGSISEPRKSGSFKARPMPNFQKIHTKSATSTPVLDAGKAFMSSAGKENRMSVSGTKPVNRVSVTAGISVEKKHSQRVNSFLSRGKDSRASLSAAKRLATPSSALSNTKIPIPTAVLSAQSLNVATHQFAVSRPGPFTFTDE